MDHNNRPATGRAAARAHHLTTVGLITLLAGLIAWIWTGDLAWALTGFAGLVCAVLLSAAPYAPRRPKVTPHQAAVDNAVAETLSDQYGFLPLNVRYEAAQAARGRVEAWRASFGPDA